MALNFPRPQPRRSSTFGADKFCDPILFLQPLKLATYNLLYKHSLCSASSMPKKLLEPKLAGVWARKYPKKVCDPLLISATIEASDFKLRI